jgi:hypothetical protein
MLCIGGVLLPAGFPGMGLLNPEGYTALPLFPHPLVIPLTASQRSSFDQAHAECNAATLMVLLREPKQAAAFAAHAVEISERHGYP